MIYKEILEGLDKVSTPNHPGTLIVTDKSEAILTTDTGDVIIAAVQHGKGKIIAFAHDFYFDCILVKKKSPKFSENVLKWLTGRSQTPSGKKLVNMVDYEASSFDSKACKLIKWDPLDSPDANLDVYKSDLLSFLENGGSIICATCPWGWLQLNPGMSLNDMSLNTFLKSFGMTFTSKCLFIGNEISVADNQATYSNFGLALNKLLALDIPDEDEARYLQTVSYGFAALQDIKNDLSFLMTPEQLERIHNMYEVELNRIPTKEAPICDQRCKAYATIFGKCLGIKQFCKAPGICEFPGDFTDDVALLLQTNIQIEFEAKFEGEWHSTGFYLPAGVGGTVRVLECDDLEAWTVRIGAHVDDLSACESITRWPCISSAVKMCGRESECPEIVISSPYGGLVYLESSRVDAKIKAVLGNVVESPYFDLKDSKTLKKWSERRKAPGLWTELAGKHIIFTTPSSCIRHLDDPRPILEYWDKVVQLHHTLRGTLPSDQKRERVVNDIQPSVGYMHSGYPIVTELDVCQKDHEYCIFNLDIMRAKGNWGLFHELGHNMQRDEWTFDGSIEVTVNFFSLHAYHLLVGHDINQVYWLSEQKSSICRFLAKRNTTFEDWESDPGVGLYTFAVLFKHFGWESIYKFLKEYERDLADKASAYLTLPNDNQEKLDQWVLRYSKIVACNIGPHFRRFGLPVSKDVDKRLADLKPLAIDIQPEAFFTN